ncbi:cytochrome c oxidase assembly factor 3 homolog, mitochondrial [Cololabis saira]|uniref:cytochrome c oxidase assembly factor 3 homolog, mitochondrial n=1 Tax=Cololabis saira TaxID=129043 RepID=UPI002AD4AD04|nr:cytochrome c oxidase assembly factor 3 homolog, mitochondrial [Cololabis saira]
MAEEGASAPSAAQKQLLRRRQELDSFSRNAARLRSRNLLTGLTIGAFVLGLFSYTILSVKQERVVEELDEEARIHIMRGPRTGANS